MKLFVGNLSSGVTEDILKSTFSEFGEILSVSVIMDRFSGNPKGFGFVEMVRNSDADKALKALNGTALMGKVVKVNQVQAKSKKQQKRRRY